MDCTLIIYVKIVVISWMKTDEVQFAMSASQGGFILSMKTDELKKSRWQSV